MIGAPLAGFTYWFLIDAHHSVNREADTSSRSKVDIPGYEDLNGQS